MVAETTWSSQDWPVCKLPREEVGRTSLAMETKWLKWVDQIGDRLGLLPLTQNGYRRLWVTSYDRGSSFFMFVINTITTWKAGAWEEMKLEERML